MESGRCAGEFELLLACVGMTASGRGEDRINLLLHHELDWDVLLRAAFHHRLGPILDRALQRAPARNRVPPEALARLRERALGAAALHLIFVCRLREILDAFDRRGVPAIPFKGPLLSEIVYGAPGLREFSDLDILVRRQDVASAAEILQSEGFCYPHTDEPDVMGLRSEYHYPFVRQGQGAMVELHCEVSPHSFCFDLDTGGLFARATQESLMSRPAPSLSPEDLLLFLCMHGAKHQWQHLESVGCVAGLIRRRPGIDWRATFDRARRLGSMRMLLLGLALARDLCAAVVPQAPLPDGQAERLARLVQAQHAGMRPSAALFVAAPWFHMRARERLRDRARYCVRGLFAPEGEDYELRPLPRRAFFVYRLWRPFRVLGRYAGAAARAAFEGLHRAAKHEDASRKCGTF